RFQSGMYAANLSVNYGQFAIASGKKLTTQGTVYFNSGGSMLVNDLAQVYFNSCYTDNTAISPITGGGTVNGQPAPQTFCYNSLGTPPPAAMRANPQARLQPLIQQMRQRLQLAKRPQ